MRPLTLMVVAILLAAGCKGPEDHRADTTIGPTPVGRGDLSSVPPRPTRTSTPSPRPTPSPKARWSAPQGDGIAAAFNAEPLPASVQRLLISGAQTAFEPGQTYPQICPRVRTLYGVSEPETAQAWIKDSATRTGYTVVATPRLSDVETSVTPIVQASAADGSFDLTLSLARAAPNAPRPFTLYVDFVQRCGF
jgi:hypothetical protein